MKVKRKIVHIDEDKCNGCGLCIPNCAEGALKIVNGKAKLVSDVFCDGLGACLGHCPQDAIHMIERESEEFDETAVEQHLENIKEKSGECAAVQPHASPRGCPGAQLKEFKKGTAGHRPSEAGPSELTQWPVQLNLVPPTAPFLKDADLVVVADCVPAAYPDFHQGILKNKKIVMGCPKFDDIEHYIEKISQMVKVSGLKSIAVAIMEVPCCSVLSRAVREAIKISNANIPFEEIIISLRGERL
ncbi:MAG: 4Fe-4S binding protein [Candidatus Omnitrophica bacterium]|nr:4Fe-4S binding protein [Candidatus Omnitrophota bacterium]